jgi:predicted nucleic acid-binding protein
MTAGLTGIPIVVDTVIISWLLSRNSQVAPYEPHLTGRQLVISFITVAELRYGAVKGNWGEARRQRLEERISAMRVVSPDNDLVNAYVDMRAKCQRLGHGLQAKEQEADRWIAATAIRYGLQLVSHDGIFDNVPGLMNIRMP